MKNLFCTVCTPTYNREKNLKVLYKSLLEQDFKNFEWIIVDDGSIDNTEEYVKKIIKEDKLNISYIKQKNGGKHVAVNNGIDHAKGEVFAIVDSDDYLTKDSLLKIKNWFSEIEKENNGKKYAGVVGRKGYSENEGVGTTFKETYVDAKKKKKKKYNITGDRFEVFYTNILKSNKFPVFPGEKFLSEVVLWNRIARQDYYLRYYQDIIYICEYLDNGLTNNIYKHIKMSPKGYALNIREQVKYDNISFFDKIREYSLYYSIRKDAKSLTEIAKEIDTNIFILIFAYTIRKIYFMLKK